ncbi:ATP12 family chaperone protein [Rhizorhapis suberifaciens]|uniref:Chaperone required for assembly of F1-ATPase n=1 Tax=Rhizorhapis suberifaciens TaxID=13656 RepID=A0A840HQI9_9SPHN|nr:ATP12 family protein [Rhizorhapis suberifaciens]MBB4640332.1 chaperone required for assembly of F1-ATPase [Rhizorhapis suberifaciens]
MKRFYKEAEAVADEGGYGIRLDGRPVRTPGRAPLMAPTAGLAERIAREWAEQGEEIDPRAMRFTGLANAAIDRVAPDHAAFSAGIAAYGESDLLCYRAAEPPPLVERQSAIWDPLLDWAFHRYDVHFTIVTGIMHQPQPEATLDRLRAAVSSHSSFLLAGLSPIVSLTGSLVAGLALLEGAADAGAIWDAAQLDELWQAEMWGEDALAAQIRAQKRAEYDDCVTFCALAQ